MHASFHVMQDGLCTVGIVAVGLRVRHMPTGNELVGQDRENSYGVKMGRREIAPER